jgi:hypothetical protein
VTSAIDLCKNTYDNDNAIRFAISNNGTPPIVEIGTYPDVTIEINFIPAGFSLWNWIKTNIFLT